MFIFASQNCAAWVGVPFRSLPKIGQSIQAKANEITGKKRWFSDKRGLELTEPSGEGEAVNQ
jgi:hypothetical protein